MDDLKFENQLLMAEVAALRLEVQTANEKRRVQDQNFASLSLQVKEMEATKKRAKILQQENTKLCNELIQMENEEIELERFKKQIAELEHTIKNYRESDHEKEMGNLAKLMMKQDNIIRELNKDVRILESERIRLQEGNNGVAKRIESRQVQEEKKSGKVRPEIVWFALGGCTSGGLALVIWILRMIL